jgi:hypothetical protein
VEARQDDHSKAIAKQRDEHVAAMVKLTAAVAKQRDECTAEIETKQKENIALLQGLFPSEIRKRLRTGFGGNMRGL